ncbi:helix-turn-helix transcriptional regulator [Pseudomonas donghuensis]|uniref:helix-turn-helix transcriptional regulator n=1 Tax=Pseudomonas donghuensis TaxID=1163398 RepID=UPI002852EF1B|nr:hypothetical protein [Pseudomonas donghuensis]
MIAPAADANSTADRILFLLKTRGALKTTDLASLLEITFEAARQQIQKLQAAELIVGISAPAKGAGRPSQKWTLTDAAQRRFPDAHSVLTLQLIETVEQVFGHEGVDQLITRMEKRQPQRIPAGLQPGRNTRRQGADPGAAARTGWLHGGNGRKRQRLADHRKPLPDLCRGVTMPGVFAARSCRSSSRCWVNRRLSSAVNI